MDRRTSKELRWMQLLDYVSKWGPRSKDDIYTMIYKATPGASRPVRLPVDLSRNTLDNDIRILKKKGLIEVKYRDGNRLIVATDRAKDLIPKKDLCG